MTSFLSPASDRRRAAQFLLSLMDDGFDDAMAMLKEADQTPYGDGHTELLAGLGLGCLDLLMQAYGGPVGAKEQLQLAILDVSLDEAPS